MAVAFGAIGFMDDYISIVKKRNLGLTEKQKLVLQFAVAAAYLVSVGMAGGGTTTLIPFVGRIDLGYFYYILAAVVIVGLVNAVNFTDGIDGLNSTVSFFAFLGLALCAGVLSMTGLSAMGIASAAACIGFLIWNFHPAKVFMGDTGSLFLGGMVGALADVYKRQEQGHPARKTFQALRIAVNGELDRLQEGLEAGFSILKPGGRLAVITFHSLEDRIVKQQMAKWCEGCICPKDFPVCVCGRTPQGRLIYKKGLAPSQREVEENPRARSSRLRVIEKLETNL